ncbi:MAG: PIN domain-containing protein [bacterium]|nr:PIN domain-containing protein [bacterium]
MEAVLDTSGWYAFVLKRDKFHELAVKFLNSRPYLVLPYPVLEELIALLHHREGKQLTIKIIDKLRNSQAVKIVHFDEEKEKQIWEHYKNIGRQIDYVDAAVIFLAQKLDLPVFGFDKHFKNLRLKLIP